MDGPSLLNHTKRSPLVAGCLARPDHVGREESTDGLGRFWWPRQAVKRPGPRRNELKTLETSTGGRDSLDFGNVRPRGQIPGPDQILNSRVAADNQ